jgi:hypothetical protein
MWVNPHAVGGLGGGGVAQQPQPEAEQDQRQGVGDQAERARHDGRDGVTEPAADPPPLDRGDDDRSPDQGEPDTVAAQGRVDVTGAVPDPTGGTPDQMREAHVGGSHRP